MKSLNEHPCTSLEWKPSVFTPPDFELQGQDGVFATLAFKDPEHTLARVRTAEGDWTIKHLGILNPVVTVREEGATRNLATFHPHALRHGKLKFADGAVYDWLWHHDTGRDGEFQDPDGLRLVSLRVRPGRDLGSPAEPAVCDVSLDLGASTRYRHALLACVGWFLVLFDHVKQREEAAAETALRL
jgi:hypothetical protein